MKKTKKRAEINLNLVPMIDVTSFILLALGILVMSMKKEASLDNLLKLPPVIHSDKQDTAQLQIYILPASLMLGGYINPDSTGLVAFAGKSSIPEKCPKCKSAFRDEKMEYVPNSLLDLSGAKPIASIQQQGAQTEEQALQIQNERPPAYLCANCRYEISPYVRLDEIPQLLKVEKEKVVKQFLMADQKKYEELNGAPMSAAELKAKEDSLKHSIPLLIKADNEAFYGRILQVVNMAKDTLCDIRKFVFVTNAEAKEKAEAAEKAVQEAQEKKAAR